MTSTSAKPAGFQQQPPRDPNTAALMSLIPGLGQLYNGQTRKGVLFLFVDVINLMAFLLFIFTNSIVQGVSDFGDAHHVSPNPSLKYALLQLHLGSAPSLVLVGFMVAFVAFAMRDAYDNAAHMHRRSLYPEFVMEMPEATSGSYLAHFVVLAFSFTLAFFFLIPPPPSRQVTDIEFIQNQPKVEHKVQAPRRAQHNSENAGKHEKKEVTPPSPAPKAPSTPQPKAAPQPKPVQQSKPTPQPTPRPTPQPTPRPTPTPSPHPSPSPSPHPSPSPTPHPSPTPSPSPRPNPAPTPFVHPSASPSPNPSPSPAPSLSHGSPSPTPAPRVGAGPGAGAAPGPAPVAVAMGSGSSGGSPSPTPVPVGGGSTTRGGGGGPAPAPAPSRAAYSHGGGGGSSGPVLAVAPSVPRSQGGGGGEGMRGNPDANSNPNKAPSVAAQADVDFGPYMADLQRRIKRAWFPPKGNESKRVVVVFKVHKGGELSNLRLVTSSGVAIADKAALQAVENAAPFRTLPPGASDDVDIQFTFDYNVFAGGGGGGKFRNF
jgi:TonB family protein